MPIKLNILTYNIHKGFSAGKRHFMLHEMREALKEVDTDVLFLQEVQGEHRLHSRRHGDWPEESQFEFLAEKIWPHYAYGKNAIYFTGHHGNAILSKYPFATWENINLSQVARASRSLLHGEIEIPGSDSKIHVICIHFGLFKTERSEQLSILSERIASKVSIHEPLIIAGDFNDWRQAATDYLENELGMQEVFKELEGKHAKTFPTFRPTLSTDRIYFRGVELQEGRCLKESPWPKLSDHLPLYATFLV